MATATVTPEGLIEVPKDILERLHVHAGDQLDVDIEGDRAIRIRMKPRPVSEIAGMLRPYIKHPLTLEEIDEGVAEAFRKGAV
jgi:AbrB family looped-hinge helix DNA binding protein